MSKRFPPPPCRLLPPDFDAGDWSVIEPHFDVLASREIDSVAALEAWLLDISELESALFSEEARRYIGMTCHTDDPASKEKYLTFMREIDPRMKVALDRLDRIYLASPFRAGLPRPRYEVLDRVKENEAALFREENVGIQAREAEVATGYTEISGALTVDLDGEEVTLARACLDLEEPDRDRREVVWRKVADRRFEDREKIESIFEELLELRRRIGQNAGFANYRDFRFGALRRFDYGVDECCRFHDAVREVVVPRVTDLNVVRQRHLGIDALRPWDYDVDPLSATPVRPFQTESELCELTSSLFRSVGPEFAEDFAELEAQSLLDLLSRPHKAPGGYQYFLEDRRLPFIFANAVGTHEDVQTLLHEGGHAFHSLAYRDEPLLVYRDPPIEFCEVASMGMELLAFEHLDRVYPAAEVCRVRRAHLEKTLRLLTWIAVVDAFQQWIYTATAQDATLRRQEWVRLRTAFSPDTDWSGLEKYREVEWHRQSHLFRQPFYYIEYGIAQIGALQLWILSRKDPARAVANYRRALALGGSRPLPELFEAAELRFEFGADLLGELIDDVFEEWQRLEGAGQE